MKDRKFPETNLKRFTVEGNHKTMSGSIFECATSTGVPFTKSKSSSRKLFDSTVGVAQNMYPKPI
jgi:hypothetical protein